MVLRYGIYKPASQLTAPKLGIYAEKVYTSSERRCIVCPEMERKPLCGTIALWIVLCYLSLKTSQT